MKLRYISGSRSTLKGILIPISEWKALKATSWHADAQLLPDIPEWQKQLLNERMEAYRNGLEEVFDAEDVFRDIEKDLY